MRKEELLKELDRLHGPGPWAFDQEKQRYTGTAGEYSLLVDKRNGSCTWQVEHTRYGVLVPWTPNGVVAYAKREAVDYVRAHVLGVYEEQHAQ